MWGLFRWSHARLPGVHPFLLLAEPLLHELVGSFGAVVPSPEPLIERDETIGTVVHLEILMMKVVGISVAIHRPLVGDLELVEADVGLGQEEFAKAAGVASRTVFKLESDGEITIKSLEKILVAFAVHGVVMAYRAGVVVGIEFVPGK
jgi:DNA-binding XRE family transcriptional regulator